MKQILLSHIVFETTSPYVEFIQHVIPIMFPLSKKNVTKISTGRSLTSSVRYFFCSQQ